MMQTTAARIKNPARLRPQCPCRPRHEANRIRRSQPGAFRSLPPSTRLWFRLDNCWTPARALFSRRASAATSAKCACIPIRRRRNRRGRSMPAPIRSDATWFSASDNTRPIPSPAGVWWHTSSPTWFSRDSRCYEAGRPAALAPSETAWGEREAEIAGGDDFPFRPGRMQNPRGGQLVQRQILAAGISDPSRGRLTEDQKARIDAFLEAHQDRDFAPAKSCPTGRRTNDDRNAGGARAPGGTSPASGRRHDRSLYGRSVLPGAD